jgi:C1A family cysteine protease
MSKITPQGHILGWRRDSLDYRDHLFLAPQTVVAKLPPMVDLRPHMPPVYDQGDLGSCTSNAIGGIIQFIRMKTGEQPAFEPSRLFIYYNERSIEHSIAADAGAEIRDGMKSVNQQGVCSETQWPYIATPADPITGLFPVGSAPVTRPPAAAYTSALRYRAINYARVQQTLSQLKGCLAAGYPYVFGFSVFDNIYDVNGNPVVNLPMPNSDSQLLGGHAVAAVGYSDATARFTIRNSWGPRVQDHGYFYMPYQFMTDYQLVGDTWVIRQESA